MFQANSRVEHKQGTRFYEQDILCSDYIFAGDTVIDFTVDYRYPGIGILLAADNGKPINEADHVYLFKLGDNDFRVIEKHFLSQSVPVEATCAFASYSVNNNANLIFSKRGQVVEIHLVIFNPVTGARELRELGHYTFKNTVDKYRIGFYSNAGNTLKYASVASSIPRNWMVNIKNTNGGRVAFFRDGFTIEGCEYDAELEQQEIRLEAGTYYLDFERSNINGKNDIQSFVFLSADDRFDDTKKNILVGDRFVLSQAASVNLKFKGTSGRITNVCIKDQPQSDFVETDLVPVTQEGSHIIVNLVRIKNVRWKGTITELPAHPDLTQEAPYGIVVTKHQKLIKQMANIELGKEYQYTYTTATKQLVIERKDELYRTLSIDIREDDQNKLILFQNMSAQITELIITDDDGKESDVLLQKTYRKYVPGTIKGAITVTDEYDMPLDLSASYREIQGEKVSYLFTNWEREIFPDAREPIILEKSIIDLSGNLRVYGIPVDARIQRNSVFRIPNKNMVNAIDLYASEYDIISDADIHINYDRPEIEITPEVKALYKEFVVEYLKDDSFCINYLPDHDLYEVEVSCSKDKVFMRYDITEDGNTTEYQITTIKPDKNKYIVLRKG